MQAQMRAKMQAQVRAQAQAQAAASSSGTGTGRVYGRDGAVGDTAAGRVWWTGEGVYGIDAVGRVGAFTKGQEFRREKGGERRGPVKW